MADVLGVFRKVAPFISTALSAAGPVGAMAGSALTQLLGSKVESSDDLAAAYAASPDKQDFILKLKQGEQAYQLQMKQLDITSVDQLEAIAAGDRANARDMQVKTRSWIPSVLACVVVVGFLSLLGLIMAGYLKISDNPAMLLLLGALSAAFGSVIQYYFGSSAGSDRKTELLANGSGK